MTYEVKKEKIIQRPVRDVFEGLKAGLLFMNCGADSGSIQIDFRVGGKYQIDFKNKTLRNFGEFIEIIPDKKIVFNWCQTFGSDQKPDTIVSIELFDEGPRTRLTLLHTGFKTTELKDGHQFGWDNGTSDFANQLENGELRMVRSYPVTAAKLLETCKNSPDLFSFLKDSPVKFSESTMTWNHSVTLTFNTKDDGTSALNINHGGLGANWASQKAYRLNWEETSRKIAGLLK